MAPNLMLLKFTLEQTISNKRSDIVLRDQIHIGNMHNQTKHKEDEHNELHNWNMDRITRVPILYSKGVLDLSSKP